ncbi:hypothetical protein MN608_08573 [Microdochium nivale]|nr:hypothetical protein MN608_08573 [Microdochium nivale]
MLGMSRLDSRYLAPHVLPVRLIRHRAHEPPTNSLALRPRRDGHDVEEVAPAENTSLLGETRFSAVLNRSRGRCLEALAPKMDPLHRMEMLHAAIGSDKAYCCRGDSGQAASGIRAYLIVILPRLC